MRQIRRFYLPSATFLFCIIFFLPAMAQDKLSEIVNKTAPSTVVILTYDKDGKRMGQGSGFFISQSGDIITNKHVLAGANSAEVKTTDGKVYPIMLIVAEDKDADIIRVAVEIPQESVLALSVCNSIPRVGERIAVIGSPLGLERTVSDGIVSAVRNIPAFGNIYQITAPVSSGSSGSPVVNMMGEVIGVVTFQVIEGQNLNFAIPGERITKLKAEGEKTYTQWRTEKTKESSDSAKGLYDKGVVFALAGECRKALPYFEEAIKKDPHNASAYVFFGCCIGDAGLHTQAIDAFKQAIRIQPDYAEAHYNLGVAYLKLGRNAECIDANKQAIRFKPDYAEAHGNLGAAYYNLKGYTEAIDANKQAIRFKPDYAEAHFALGVSYGRLRRYPESIDAFKQAIRIKPDFVDAHFYLAVIYLNIKDKSSALDQYKILKTIDPNRANELFNLIYK